MTCSEIISAHEAPTRKVFMRGDLVCNKDMVVIVNHPTFLNGNVFHGTILYVDEKKCDKPLGLATVLDSRNFNLFTEKLLLTVK